MCEIFCGARIPARLDAESAALLQAFGALYDRARMLLPNCKESLEQVLAIETEEGRVICKTVLLFSENEGALLEEIGEAAVVKMLCMWKDGSLDLPSYDLRSRLCQRNPASADAKLLLVGRDRLLTKTVGVTLPPSQ